MADLKVDVIDLTGKKAGNVELDSAVFGLEPNIPLLHQVVNAQLAARRAGTAKTKTRGEVSGGGVVHGPVPRDYSQRTPKKMIAAALRQSLSDRAKHDRVHIVKGFVEGDKPSTKVALKFLLEVTEGRKALVVVDRTDELTILSLRNAQEAHLLYFDQLNAYDVLVADDVVFTEAAYEAWTNKEETK